MLKFSQKIRFLMRNSSQWWELFTQKFGDVLFVVRCSCRFVVVPPFSLTSQGSPRSTDVLVHWNSFTYTVSPSQTKGSDRRKVSGSTYSMAMKKVSITEVLLLEWRCPYDVLTTMWLPTQKDTWNLMGCFGVHLWPSCTHQSLRFEW